MTTLNLGILAHVDAGKTSLTERLLYATGVITEIGRVDDGSTQTDSLALERARGITIKTAVASFGLDGTAVNLIDTPGHPDFIAEVERVLSVLDGAVLVVSAVEGVQAQTRVLMRTLRRLRIPTLIFVNKIDRTGARAIELLPGLADRLGIRVVALGSARGVGSRAAAAVDQDLTDPAFRSRLTAVLAEQDEDLLAAFVTDRPVPYPQLRSSLARQTRSGLVHPVVFGSALTGTGVAALLRVIPELLPPAHGDPTAPASGTVFKVERGPAGEKIAYARMFAGTVRARDRIRVGAATEDQVSTGEKVTAVSVFEPGKPVDRDQVSAGQIGKLWGLAGVRIGDPIGVPRAAGPAFHFAPPSLETVITPVDPTDRGRLYTALTQLAEQDPLIDLRRRDGSPELSVSLYGEVQKEVIEATLAQEYSLAVTFQPTTAVCVERVVGVGAAAEFQHQPPNPFLATVGLRIEPAPVGTGVEFALEVELGAMPLAFFTAVEDAVRATLLEGLAGWPIPDCRVAMTHSGYSPRQSHAHARFDKSMSSTGRDFRHLTPLVLVNALAQAGTQVCEPVDAFELDVPDATTSAVVPALIRLGAVPQGQQVRGSSCLITGTIPAARVHELRQQLPPLSHGEGLLESTFDHYAPVRGQAPYRTRSVPDALHRKEYLLQVERRAEVAPAP